MITSFVAEDGEAVYSQQKKGPEPHYGSDHQLLTTKFRFKLKKAGKTTVPARYDLNQIPYEHAAAAAKSLQLCPTLCDPIDSSPPGSPVPGILQARTLEWVAISFSKRMT